MRSVVQVRRMHSGGTVGCVLFYKYIDNGTGQFRNEYSHTCCVLQIVLNVCYCGSLVAAGIAYSLLTTRDINTNYDHIGAAILAFSG